MHFDCCRFTRLFDRWQVVCAAAGGLLPQKFVLAQILATRLLAATMHGKIWHWWFSLFHAPEESCHFEIIWRVLGRRPAFARLSVSVHAFAKLTSLVPKLDRCGSFIRLACTIFVVHRRLTLLLRLWSICHKCVSTSKHLRFVRRLSDGRRPHRARHVSILTIFRSCRIFPFSIISLLEKPINSQYLVSERFHLHLHVLLFVLPEQFFPDISWNGLLDTLWESKVNYPLVIFHFPGQFTGIDCRLILLVLLSWRVCVIWVLSQLFIIDDLWFLGLGWLNMAFLCISYVIDRFICVFALFVCCSERQARGGPLIESCLI